jgi:DNA-binding response OmpR family regulator
MPVIPAAATLLYVEDELLTQECVALALREAGFAVVTAENGVTAVGMLEAAAEPFLGLITDVNLGEGPDGWEIARRARTLFDTMRVVYVSGASQDQWTSQGVPQSIMIAKPFAPVQVVVAMSSLLNTVDI